MMQYKAVVLAIWRALATLPSHGLTLRNFCTHKCESTSHKDTIRFHKVSGCSAPFNILKAHALLPICKNAVRAQTPQVFLDILTHLNRGQRLNLHLMPSVSLIRACPSARASAAAAAAASGSL